MKAPVTSRNLFVLSVVWMVLTMALWLVCSFIGPIQVRPGPGAAFWTWSLWTDPIWQARMSRLAAAAVVGAGMSAAGLGIQALLRNPLAEPYVLGIASGAGVGVRLGTMLGIGAVGLWWTPVSAAVGALGACAVVYALAQRRGHLDPFSLLLSGIIVNTFNYSLMLLLALLSDPFHVDDFARWALGEVPDLVDARLLLSCALIVAAGAVVLFRKSAAYNVLSLGADIAQSSGVSLGRLYATTFLCVGAMTAAGVALAGPIGFVGLIVPHLGRMMWGPDNRRLAVGCGFAGACLLLVADTSCRYVGHAAGVGKIPVGVVLALGGAPLFIWLMRHRFVEGAGR